MADIKYILATNNFTICTGIDEIMNGIEVELKDLVLNKKALDILNLVSVMCKTKKPNQTFEWYCNYLAQFVMSESKERNQFNLTNPTIQILCSGQLLSELKACFNQ